MTLILVMEKLGLVFVFILEMHQVLYVIIQIEVKLFRRLEIVLQNKDEEIEELLLEKVKIMRLIQKK